MFSWRFCGTKSLQEWIFKQFRSVTSPRLVTPLCQTWWFHIKRANKLDSKLEVPQQFEHLKQLEAVYVIIVYRRLTKIHCLTDNLFSLRGKRYNLRLSRTKLLIRLLSWDCCRIRAWGMLQTKINGLIVRATSRGSRFEAVYKIRWIGSFGFCLWSLQG